MTILVSGKFYTIGDFYEVSLGDGHDSDFTKSLELASGGSNQLYFKIHHDVTYIDHQRVKKHLPKEEYPEYYL